MISSKETLPQATRWLRHQSNCCSSSTLRENIRAVRKRWHGCRFSQGPITRPRGPAVLQPRVKHNQRCTPTTRATFMSALHVPACPPFQSMSFKPAPPESCPHLACMHRAYGRHGRPARDPDDSPAGLLPAPFVPIRSAARLLTYLPWCLLPRERVLVAGLANRLRHVLDFLSRPACLVDKLTSLRLWARLQAEAHLPLAAGARRRSGRLVVQAAPRAPER